MSNRNPTTPRGAAEILIYGWGVLGVVALLLQAIVRLTPHALEPVLAGSLSLGQVFVYIAWVTFSAYAEGYRSFQGRFSPRVVARALYLSKSRNRLGIALAPLFCMAFFHATRRALISAWAVTVLVIAAVLIVHHLPQPWRGIVDGGVVVGLVWGTLAILTHFVRALRGFEPAISNEVPSSAAPAAE
jgi:hypothetical protein